MLRLLCLLCAQLASAQLESDVATTGGGNGNTEGSTCKFPFTYNGMTFNGCTSIDHYMPWCYTEVGGTNGSPWGVCQQHCDETLAGEKGASYHGCQARTRSGKACMNWVAQTPHAHETTPSNFPDGGLGYHSFCRNPDGKDTIWCYTTDADKRWDYCNPLEMEVGDGDADVEDDDTVVQQVGMNPADDDDNTAHDYYVPTGNTFVGSFPAQVVQGEGEDKIVWASGESSYVQASIDDAEAQRDEFYGKKGNALAVSFMVWVGVAVLACMALYPRSSNGAAAATLEEGDAETIPMTPVGATGGASDDGVKAKPMESLL